MNKNDVIESIRSLESALREKGVIGIGLFGSVARDEATSESDVDILLDILRDEGFSLLDLVHIQHMLSDHLGCPVDVVTSPVRNGELAEEIGRDFIRAF